MGSSIVVVERALMLPTMQKKVDDFKSHYGSLPLVVADIWFDLCHTMIEEACLTEKRSQKVASNDL